jgi:hypothetical protein
MYGRLTKMACILTPDRISTLTYEADSSADERQVPDSSRLPELLSKAVKVQEQGVAARLQNRPCASRIDSTA